MHSLIHYLDDFLFLGPPHSNICRVLLLSFFFFSLQGVWGPFSTGKDSFSISFSGFLGYRHRYGKYGIQIA